MFFTDLRRKHWILRKLQKIGTLENFNSLLEINFFFSSLKKIIDVFGKTITDNIQSLLNLREKK